jgi:hypothetical protein
MRTKAAISKIPAFLIKFPPPFCRLSITDQCGDLMVALLGVADDA